MKRFIFSITLCMGIYLLASSPLYAQDQETFPCIEEALVQKGITREQANKLLTDSRAYIENSVIIRNFFSQSPKDTTLNDQTKNTALPPQCLYIEPKYLVLGKEYIEQRRETLKTISERFGVSPQVITAILIMESRLFTYRERYNAFRSYLSLAACSNAEFLETFRQENIATYPQLTNDTMESQVQKKSNWALNELSCLIRLADDLSLDPLEIPSSYAGAVGPAQFIPSSFIRFGIDGDNDGKTDPFNEVDAIASIANYLKLGGWREEAPIEKKRRALWYYNHSTIYVNTGILLYQTLSEIESLDTAIQPDVQIP